MRGVTEAESAKKRQRVRALDLKHLRDVAMSASPLTFNESAAHSAPKSGGTSTAQQDAAIPFHERIDYEHSLRLLTQFASLDADERSASSELHKEDAALAGTQPLPDWKAPVKVSAAQCALLAANEAFDQFPIAPKKCVFAITGHPEVKKKCLRHYFKLHNLLFGAQKTAGSTLHRILEWNMRDNGGNYELVNPFQTFDALHLWVTNASYAQQHPFLISNYNNNAPKGLLHKIVDSLNRIKEFGNHMGSKNREKRFEKFKFKKKKIV